MAQAQNQNYYVHKHNNQFMVVNYFSCGLCEKNSGSLKKVFRHLASKHKDNEQFTYMRITENLLKRTKKKEIYRTDVTCGHAKYAYSEGRGITYDFNDGRLYSYSKKKGNFLTNMFSKRECPASEGLSRPSPTLEQVRKRPNTRQSGPIAN